MNRLDWRGREIERRIKDDAAKAVDGTLEEAAQRARSSAPARTGKLRGSVFTQPAQRGGDVIEGQVGADAPYAIYVETGTSRTPEQPFLRPAGDQTFPKLPQKIRR